MHSRNIEDKANRGTDALVNWPLQVVIAYDEIPAGKYALRVMAELGRRLSRNITCHLSTWSFVRLGEQAWAEVAIGDALRADILIIATYGTNPLPATVRAWTEAAIHRKRGSTATVVALFGPEETPDGLGSPRLEAIRNEVHGAGLDFFAPTSRLLQEGRT